MFLTLWYPPAMFISQLWEKVRDKHCQRELKQKIFLPYFCHFKFCHNRRNGFSKNYWELYCSSSKKIKLHSQHRGLDCCISQSRWTFILLFLSCKTAINKKNKKKDVGKGNEKHFKSKRWTEEISLKKVSFCEVGM